MTANDSSNRYPRSAWLIFVVVAVLAVIAGSFLGRSVRGVASPANLVAGTGEVVGGSSGTLAALSAKHLAPLRISGTQPRGLAPGVTKTVMVKIKNPNSVRVLILRAKVVVGDASESCRAHPNIRTTKYKASVPHAHRYVAPKHGTVQVPLTITMINRQDTGSRTLGTFVSGNQNACKGARFPISYRAKGQQA